MSANNSAVWLTLEELFQMQKRLQKTMFGYELPNDSVEDFKYSVLALIGELGEVLDADKRWKNIRKGEANSEDKLDELVDCMAFLVNMILFSGFSSSEFGEAFKKKNERNFERFYRQKSLEEGEQ